MKTSDCIICSYLTYMLLYYMFCMNTVILIYPFSNKLKLDFVFRFWFLQPFLFQSLKSTNFLVSSNLFCSNSSVLDYPPPPLSLLHCKITFQYYFIQLFSCLLTINVSTSNNSVILVSFSLFKLILIYL